MPTQSIANRSSRSSAIPAATAPGSPVARQPTAKATSNSTARAIAETIRSADARPISTAPCAMGIERNRSVMPRCASVTTATIVVDSPNIIVSVNRPGSSACR